MSIVDCFVGSLALEPLELPAAGFEDLSEMTPGALRPPRLGCVGRE